MVIVIRNLISCFDNIDKKQELAKSGVSSSFFHRSCVIACDLDPNIFPYHFVHVSELHNFLLLCCYKHLGRNICIRKSVLLLSLSCEVTLKKHASFCISFTDLALHEWGY